MAELGLDIGALAPSDRHVEGVVEVVLDATGHFDQTLSAARQHTAHAHPGLFGMVQRGLRVMYQIGP
ncbi:hypothetical protein J2X15_002573 [Rhodoferax saidenbachensis]|uniref:Uncharacterized protein n=1 Tax=Rhodoferax saidenbachensis TaxID=1484693 RepID=A0ABU1ZQR3_9BURK|nr:hypothetical protein [Rhodoferax saidenbachensis]